jgi:hypothetical protein
MIIAKLRTCLQLALSGTCAAVLNACAAPLPIPFNAGSASYILQRGDNAVAGRAYVVSRRGYVRSCMDGDVRLIPVTPYSKALMSRAFQNFNDGYASRAAVEALPQNEDFNKFQLRVDCDRSGHFQFEHVADGEYYVLATIYWLTRWQRNGGALLEEIAVSHGARETIALSASSN